MGDVWGHVGLGMGPILITPESIFMALETNDEYAEPGMPGAVPIGGRCPVQSKSAQHKAESGRIPAYKPPDGEGMKLPGGFIMPPPPPAPVRRAEPRLEPSQPLCPPPGAWGYGPLPGHGPYNDPIVWTHPPGFVPTTPAGGTNPNQPRGGWYERCIDLMALVDNLPFNEHTHECKHYLRQLQRI